MNGYTLHIGDCLDVLRTFDADSVDAVVTDPPYHLTTGKKGGTGPASVNLDSPAGRSRVTTGFMGQTWDGGDVAMRPEVWAECLRVLRPGGRLLAFAAPRTMHRIWCAIEDAGFTIEDTVAWLFGTGFPKHGSKLKPAYEPVCVARKGPVSLLNIDACRIAGAVPTTTRGGHDDRHNVPDSHPDARNLGRLKPQGLVEGHASGRWPANVIHDGSDEVLDAFARFGERGGSGRASGPTRTGPLERRTLAGGMTDTDAEAPFYGDHGSAARFFYCAKASRAERNVGLGGSDRPAVAQYARPRDTEHADWKARNGNHHPTVKPVDLMRYLVRLVTPPGGLVLDPFTGSGSTGLACAAEGLRFVGIEREPDYAAIAERRLSHAYRTPTLAL